MEYNILRVDEIKSEVRQPIRPMARGLAQYGGPPGRLEGSDPAGCDFVAAHAACPDGPHQLPRSGLIYY
jgi:hypothetical protein